MEVIERRFQASNYGRRSNIRTREAGTNVSLTHVTTETRFSNVFHYEAEYKVLICKIHKRAMRGLNKHLHDAHGIIKLKDRQPFMDYYARYALAKPKDVAIPPTKGPPFKALGEPNLAYKCTDCSHISISCKAMRGHCNKRHQWHYSEDTPINWGEVRVQSFFEGFNQKYFIVED